MRLERRMVFDDWVYGSARTTSVHDDFLGKFDQLAVHVLLTKYDHANGSLVVTAEQSGDGYTWVSISTLAAVGTVLPIPYNPFAGAVQGAQLGFVRLLIELRGQTTRGRVRVVVTGRDRGAWAEVEHEVEVRQKVEKEYSNPEERLGEAYSHPEERLGESAVPYETNTLTKTMAEAILAPHPIGPDEPYHPI